MAGSTMKSLILAARDVVELQDRSVPELTDPHSIRVRVIATSICGSDIHLVAGHMTPEIGFALGHEWVGIVEAVGENVKLFSIGDRATGPAAPWCGSCSMCSKGQPQRCVRGGVHGSGEFMGDLGGTQSEYLIVPWADNGCIHIPDTMSDEQALTIGDVLSTGWTAVRNVKQADAGVIVIVGCGPVGLSAVLAAKAEGFKEIIAIDRIEKRLEIAKELGATHSLLSDEHTLEKLTELFPHGVPAVVDAAGVQGSLDLDAAVVAIGGRIGVLGIPARPLTVDFGALLMKNVTIWTGLGDLTHMTEIRDLITEGAIDPTPIFTHHIPLDEAVEMYKRMAGGDPSVVKTLVTIS